MNYSTKIYITATIIFLGVFALAYITHEHDFSRCVGKNEGKKRVHNELKTEPSIVKYGDKYIVLLGNGVSHISSNKEEVVNFIKIWNEYDKNKTIVFPSVPQLKLKFYANTNELMDEDKPYISNEEWAATNLKSWTIETCPQRTEKKCIFHGDKHHRKDISVDENGNEVVFINPSSCPSCDKNMTEFKYLVRGDCGCTTSANPKNMNNINAIRYGCRWANSKNWTNYCEKCGATIKWYALTCDCGFLWMNDNEKYLFKNNWWWDQISLGSYLHRKCGKCNTGFNFHPIKHTCVDKNKRMSLRECFGMPIEGVPDLSKIEVYPLSIEGLFKNNPENNPPTNAFEIFRKVKITDDVIYSFISRGKFDEANTLREIRNCERFWEDYESLSKSKWFWSVWNAKTELKP